MILVATNHNFNIQSEKARAYCDICLSIDEKAIYATKYM